MSKWIELSDWKDLPVGTWLTKSKSKHSSYNVAYVTNKTGDGHKMIIVGGHFHWDADMLIAYCSFENYGEDSEIEKE